jgi:hypothetical protein
MQKMILLAINVAPCPKCICNTVARYLDEPDGCAPFGALVSRVINNCVDLKICPLEVPFQILKICSILRNLAIIKQASDYIKTKLLWRSCNFCIATLYGNTSAPMFYLWVDQAFSISLIIKPQESVSTITYCLECKHLQNVAIGIPIEGRIINFELLEIYSGLLFIARVSNNNSNIFVHSK